MAEADVLPLHECNVRTSTPCNVTPVKSIPELGVSPITGNQNVLAARKSGGACFICGNTTVKSLRSISSNVPCQQASPVFIELKKCFSIELTLGKEFFKMKICLTCKRSLEKVSSFKDQVDSVVSIFSQKDADDSLGCFPLPQEDACQAVPPRMKRMLPSDSSPTPGEKAGKKTSSGKSKRSLSFSEHSYTRSSTPHEEARSLTNENLSMFSKLTQGKLLSDEDSQAILFILAKPCPTEKELALKIYRSSFMQTMEAVMIQEMNTVMVRLCSKTISPGPSVLRTYGNAKDLKSRDVMSEAAVELKREQPFLCKLLTTLCDPPGDVEQRSNTHHVVSTIYGMLLYNRNKDVNAIQKMNTAAAVRLHAKNDLLEIQHRCGLSLAQSYKLDFLDTLGKFNTDGIVESLRLKKTGKVTIDNIDGMTTKKEIRLDDGNQYYHHTASTYYPDRCLPEELSHLSTAEPEIPRLVNCAVFFLNPEEEAILKKNYGYQVNISVGLVRTSQFRWFCKYYKFLKCRDSVYSVH